MNEGLGDGGVVNEICSHELPCHETTARAARLEQEILVTLVRLVSNASVFLEYQLGILKDSATPLLQKGRKDCVLDEA